MSSQAVKTVRELLGSVARLGALRAAALVFATLTSVIVARHLGPAGFGQVAFALAVLNLVAIPSNSGIGPLLVRQISVQKQAREWSNMLGLLQWSRKIALAAALGAALPLALWSAWHEARVDSEFAKLMLVGAAMVVFWALLARTTAILQALQRVALAQSIDWLVNPAFYLLFIVALWWAGLLTPVSVLVSMLAALAVSVLVGAVLLSRALPGELSGCPPSPSRPDWYGSWFRFSLIQGVSVVNGRAPVLLLGIMSTEVEAGLFRVADSIASLLTLALLVVNTALGPHVSRLYAQGKLDEIRRLARLFARVALAVSLPAGVVVVLWGEPLLRLIFGAEFSAAWLAMVILAVGHLVNISCGSVGLILNMTGHERQALNSWGLALLVNFLLGMILIPLYGATGAAVAAAVSTSAWNILLLLYTNKLLGMRPSAF